MDVNGIAAAIDATITPDNVLDEQALTVVLNHAINQGITTKDVCAASQAVQSAESSRTYLKAFADALAKQGDPARAEEYAYRAQRMFATQAALQKTLSRFSEVAGAPDASCVMNAR
jgi:hypothetical protein